MCWEPKFITIGRFFYYPTHCTIAIKTYWNLLKLQPQRRKVSKGSGIGCCLQEKFEPLHDQFANNNASKNQNTLKIFTSEHSRHVEDFYATGVDNTQMSLFICFTVTPAIFVCPFAFCVSTVRSKFKPCMSECSF